MPRRVSSCASSSTCGRSGTASSRRRSSSAASACATSRARCRNKNDLARLRVRDRFDPGPDLFSQGPTSRVSLALTGLTTVFGMGTGVTPSLQGPRHPFYRSAYAPVNLAPRRASTAELAVATNVHGLRDRIGVPGRRVAPTLREKPPGDRAEQRDRDDKDPDPLHVAHRTPRKKKGAPLREPLFERHWCQKREDTRVSRLHRFGAPDPRPGWVMN